jgi:hypothetical protein
MIERLNVLSRMNRTGNLLQAEIQVSDMLLGRELSDRDEGRIRG